MKNTWMPSVTAMPGTMTGASSRNCTRRLPRNECSPSARPADSPMSEATTATDTAMTVESTRPRSTSDDGSASSRSGRLEVSVGSSDGYG